MTGATGITVAIPTIPPRHRQLARAVASVAAQTLPPDAISIAVDNGREGAALTRDRAWGAADTPWVALLDDDDELYEDHLEALMSVATADVDLVYPWFDVGGGGTDPFPQWENQPWDDATPHQVPVTFLVRRQLLADLGGFSHDWDPTLADDPGIDAEGNRAGEDYRFILRAVRAGAEIVHLPRRTWRWHHHQSNTMGLPSRW